MPDNLIQVGATVDLSELKQLVTQSDQVTAAYQRLADAQLQTNVSSAAASEAMVEVSKKTVDVRHSIGLLDNTIRGAHGQAMADVIRLFGKSALVMNALPIAATGAGLVLLGGIAVDVAEKIMGNAEAQREAWITIDSTVQDTTTKIQEAIERQEQKYIELTQGPIAALEYELTHVRSIAIQVFADIEREMQRVSEQMLKDGGWIGVAAISKEAGEDVKKTLADMDKAVHDSALANPKDVFAPFLAEQKVLQDAIKRTSDLIARRSAAMGADKSLVEPLQKELELFQSINTQINLQMDEQKQLDKTRAQELASKRDEQRDDIVDVSALARAHGTLAAQMRKVEQETRNQVQIGPELARLWETAARQARQYLDTIKTGYEGEIELARANEQATEAVLAAELANHKITKNQEVLAVRDAKLKELKQEEDYLKAIQSLYLKGTKEWQEYQNQLNLIQAKALKIRANADAQTAKATDQEWRHVITGMQGEFSSFTQSLISGHQTLAQSWDNLVNGMTAKFIEGLQRQLLELVVNSAIKDGIEQTESQKTTLRTAAEAAQKSYSWAADWGGPPAGAVAAGIAFAAVEAFGSAASYDIGSNFVPVTGLAMVHKGEQIIPANQQGPGYSGGHLQIHFNISSMDGQDAARVIMKNSRSIANAVTKELKKKGVFGQ